MPSRRCEASGIRSSSQCGTGWALGNEIPRALTFSECALSTYDHTYDTNMVCISRYTVCMNLKKPRPKCPVCGKEPARSDYKYCSNACQHEFQYLSYIAKWRDGKVKGLLAMGVVSGYVKRYLRRKFGNKCCLCGWSEVNPKSNIVPLVADHIDGNWKNNSEENLRLICPNCDSLSPTYAGLNKGNGRPSRVISKRALEAQSLARKGKS